LCGHDFLCAPFASVSREIGDSAPPRFCPRLKVQNETAPVNDFSAV
jgi:hypothetical protein